MPTARTVSRILAALGITSALAVTGPLFADLYLDGGHWDHTNLTLFDDTDNYSADIAAIIGTGTWDDPLYNPTTISVTGSEFGSAIHVSDSYDAMGPHGSTCCKNSWGSQKTVWLNEFRLEAYRTEAGGLTEGQKRQGTISHELGHAVGLGHVDWTGRIMRPGAEDLWADGVYKLDSGSGAALYQLYN